MEGTLLSLESLSLRVWYPLALRALRRAMVAANRVPQMGCAEAAVIRVLLAPEGLWNSIMTASVCVCSHQMD